MSLEKYDDNCPGCRPAFLNLETNEVLPEDDPIMVKVLAIWAETSVAERRAYHRVMCLNSRDAIDLFIVNRIIAKLKGEKLHEM
jgi:hypothetical protein